MTLSEALTRGTSELEASPWLRADAGRDALFLLLYMAGITRAAYLTDPDRILDGAQQAAYDTLIQRRLMHEPIQYITGEQEFYGLALHVTPAVLIPRPETEHLVEAVLAELDSQKTLRVLDVGTGSCAIAIALAHHLPHAQIVATDISGATLKVAAENAVQHDVAGRIRFAESDLLQELPPSEALFDAIVSNPPYVPSAERDDMHPQVREHEPATALFAGADGLDIYRRLIPQARVALKPGGLLALEIGHGQRDAVASLLAGWEAVRFVDDLKSIPRVALARRP